MSYDELFITLKIVNPNILERWIMLTFAFEPKGEKY